MAAYSRACKLICVADYHGLNEIEVPTIGDTLAPLVMEFRAKKLLDASLECIDTIDMIDMIDMINMTDRLNAIGTIDMIGTIDTIDQHHDGRRHPRGAVLCHHRPRRADRGGFGLRIRPKIHALAVGM
jgi:hypothetical protein